jgi:hypothetical protein
LFEELLLSELLLEPDELRFELLEDWLLPDLPKKLLLLFDELEEPDEFDLLLDELLEEPEELVLGVIMDLLPDVLRWELFTEDVRELFELWFLTFDGFSLSFELEEEEDRDVVLVLVVLLTGFGIPLGTEVLIRVLVSVSAADREFLT